MGGHETRAGKQGRGGVKHILAYSLEAHSPSWCKRCGVRLGPGPQALVSSLGSQRAVSSLQNWDLATTLKAGPQRDSLSPSMCYLLKVFLSCPRIPIMDQVPEGACGRHSDHSCLWLSICGALPRPQASSFHQREAV